MSQSISCEPIEFDSTDGRTKVHGSIWTQSLHPRAVVQIVHGMSEHIKRYDCFARQLTSFGYAVCAHDQVGHGASSDATTRGHIPARTGRDVLIEDTHKLRLLVAGIFPDTPWFMFGHSMGSFVVRSYIARHGEGLSGAILCGTGFTPPAACRSLQAWARVLARTKGEMSHSTRLDTLVLGGFARAIPNSYTPFDWLSHNRENVRRYMADDLCGFPFTIGGYATLMSLTADSCSQKCARNTPDDLPLLFISGSEDPVGDMGRGVSKACHLVREGGSTDVRCKIYPGMRHEILNELDCDLVYRDVLTWLGSCLQNEADIHAQDEQKETAEHDDENSQQHEVTNERDENDFLAGNAGEGNEDSSSMRKADEDSEDNSTAEQVDEKNTEPSENAGTSDNASANVKDAESPEGVDADIKDSDKARKDDTGAKNAEAKETQSDAADK